MNKRNEIYPAIYGLYIFFTITWVYTHIFNSKNHYFLNNI